MKSVQMNEDGVEGADLIISRLHIKWEENGDTFHHTDKSMIVGMRN